MMKWMMEKSRNSRCDWISPVGMLLHGIKTVATTRWCRWCVHILYTSPIFCMPLGKRCDWRRCSWYKTVSWTPIIDRWPFEMITCARRSIFIRIYVHLKNVRHSHPKIYGADGHNFRHVKFQFNFFNFCQKFANFALTIHCKCLPRFSIQ